MEANEILSHIDHTLLKAVSDKDSIMRLCKEAVEYKTASVCVPPSYVKMIRENFSELKICTVIGFPLGYCTKEVKVFETGGRRKKRSG